MASLQLRHSRGCATGRPWTAVDKAEGCTCEPVYHVAFRHDDKLVRERVGRNRKIAERALHKLSTAVDEGEWQPREDVTFRVWGRTWLTSLERKETTKVSYASTISAATDVFGSKLVRRLGASDVAAFSAKLRETVVGTIIVDGVTKPRLMSDSTRAKHLRVLSAALASAVQHGCAAQNPVRLLPQAEKPRPRRRESAYFLDSELPALVDQLDGIFHVLVLTALKTGARQGELLALEWRDIDVAEQVIRVRRSVTGGHVGLPKNHERRDVHVTEDVVSLLSRWWAELGRPDDSTLVFPGATGYLDPTAILRRELYPAMVRAEIPREGPTGELRTFHSLRHTFARIALEHGAELTWLSRHLGHSGTQVTDTVYGHWSTAARRRQVKRLEGAFVV